MSTTKWLTAAAIATAMAATPALAKDTMKRDQSRAEMKMKKHKMAKHHAMRMTRQDRMARRGAANGDLGFDDDYAANDDWSNGWTNNGYWRSNTGFFPGDVASGIVGGAVATAGAAVNTAGATAPFGGYNNSYAYAGNGGWNPGWDGFFAAPQNPVQARATAPGATPPRNGNWATNDVTASYAERNGFVCTPGTYFMAQNGRRTLCQ